MMNQMNLMYLFSGCGEKICYVAGKERKVIIYITYLIKTSPKGVHRVHRFINFMRKLINIHNINQLIHIYDVPMYTYVHTGAYAFFMPCIKNRVFGKVKMESKSVLFEGQTTSRYIGSSIRDYLWRKS